MGARKADSPAEHARDDAPPESVEAALSRARQHAGRASAEALACVRALLDAAALGAKGKPARALPALTQMDSLLRDLAATLDPAVESSTKSLLDSVADALDAEVSRWETRASQDPDARAVLRAYLGLREILWEVGVRRPTAQRPERESSSRTGKPQARRGRRPSRRGPRVQRVHVEG